MIVTIEWTATFKTQVEVPDNSRESLAAAGAELDPNHCSKEYQIGSFEVNTMKDENGKRLYP